MPKHLASVLVEILRIWATMGDFDYFSFVWVDTEMALSSEGINNISLFSNCGNGWGNGTEVICVGSGAHEGTKDREPCIFLLESQ